MSDRHQPSTCLAALVITGFTVIIAAYALGQDAAAHLTELGSGPMTRYSFADIS